MDVEAKAEVLEKLIPLDSGVEHSAEFLGSLLYGAELITLRN